MKPEINHSNLVPRRAFLSGGIKATVGVCALASLKPFGLQGADAPAKRKANLRFGFTTYQWGQDWDIPTLIGNLTKAKVLGVELRTSQSYSHGVELTLTAAQRADVKKRFADSPVALVGIASGERMDWPDPEKLKAAIENSKGYVKLSNDVGASGVRVFPNQFHPNVPREKTIEQIARALNQVGAFAADYRQEIRLEAHGQAGDLPIMRSIMDRVTQRNVRVKLNSDARDAAEFEQRFNLVKDFLGHTVHLHNLKDAKFPYQLQTDLLAKVGWDGWALMEASDKVPDRVQALIEQRQLWEKMVANSVGGPR